MLNPQGRIVGEFTVARVGDDEFFLFGSQAAEMHHSRWFLDHLPDRTSPISLRGARRCRSVGLSLAGPRARDVLQKVTDDIARHGGLPVHGLPPIDIGMIPAWVGRLTYSGDLGYELWVAPEYQRALFDLLMEAGEEFGIRLFGFRALMSLRIEKSFGTWFREYRPIYTPLEAGMVRYIKLDHDFIGRERAARPRWHAGPSAAAGDAGGRARCRGPSGRDR